MSELPSDGIEGLKENWKSDILSGFLMFLIALPLSLGIAMASGVPPLSGIIAAVVGGLVVSMTSGSYVTINGPAAGLIVVILGGVNSLGGGIEGYKLTLAAITIAGLLQIVAGLTKAGRFCSLFPSSAVHGLLASIGIIIIAKQTYIMLGIKPVGKTALQQLAALPSSLSLANPELALIGLLTLATVIILPMIKPLKRFPAALVGVTIGMCLATYFDLSHEHTYLAFQNHEYKLGPDALVTLPSNLSEGIVHPDWSRLADPIFWKATMMIFIIASLETLLSCAAVDKLDLYHRKADLNRDLTAIGLGTAISGWLGGLPMIAEIVRSSANVNAGAKTRWSNFFHGLFMLTFVIFASGLIHRIPQASLAAILVFTGFRLASPREFRKTWSIGSDQMLIFVTTICVTLGTDLLIGILSGVLVKLVLHLLRGNSLSQLLRCNMSIKVDNQKAHCGVDGSLAFTNLMFVKEKLESIPGGLDLQIDLTETKLVDHSAMEFLEHFQHDYERDGGRVSLIGLESHRSVSSHPLSARTR